MEKDAPPCLNLLTKKAPWKGLGADSEEKHEPVSDIDTAAVDSLKTLDPKRPIREADVETAPRGTVRGAEMASGRLACRNLNRAEECNDISHGLIEVLVQEEVARIRIELELGSGNQTRKLLRTTDRAPRILAAAVHKGRHLDLVQTRTCVMADAGLCRTDERMSRTLGVADRLLLGVDLVLVGIEVWQRVAKQSHVAGGFMRPLRLINIHDVFRHPRAIAIHLGE